MFQLFYILGSDYVVWDKASTIEFKRPGKSTLSCDFVITDELVDNIQSEVKSNGSYVFKLPVELRDKDGLVVSHVEKTIYVASKQHYSNRKSA